MAFPSVEATNTSEEGSQVTSHTVDLPAGIESGDLLILAFAETQGTTVTTPTGWTLLVAEDNGLGPNSLNVYWREADGGEGSTVSITTSGTTRSGHNTYRISGAEDPDTQPPEATIAESAGEEATADAPNLTPTGGAKDYLWLVFYSIDGGEVSAAPTDYANLIAAHGGGFGGGGIECASARRSNNASSEDPGTVSLSQDDTWVVATLAVHPATAGGTPGSASPAATGLSFSIPQATAASPGSTTPDPIATSVTTPAPGVAGSAVAEPDAITPSLSIETPTPAGAAVVAPDAVSTSFTIPTPTAVEGEDAGTAQPDAISAALTLPAPTPAGGAVALPDTIAVTVVMPAPSAKGGTTVTPDEIAVAVSLGQVTVEGGAVVTPDTIALTLTLPQATADGQVPAELIAQVINSTFGRQVVTGKQIRQAITGDTFIS